MIEPETKHDFSKDSTSELVERFGILCYNSGQEAIKKNMDGSIYLGNEAKAHLIEILRRIEGKKVEE